MKQRFDRDQAELIAIRALGSLASDPERLGRFLAVTGLGPDNLRAAATDSAFLASVLEYIVADESLLVSLAGNLGVAPDSFAKAHALLGDSHRDG